MSKKISHESLIYAHTDFLDREQITSCIQNIINKTNIKGTFMVNVVKNQGILCKYSYIWVHTKELYDLLISFENTSKVVYKKLVPIEKSTDLSDNTKSKEIKSDAIIGGRYNIFTNYEDDNDSDIPKSKYEIKSIELTIETIKYTKSQLADIKKNHPKTEHGLEECTIRFSKGLFEPITSTDKQKRVHNMWFASNVDFFVTSQLLIQSLKELFPNAPKNYPKVKIIKNQKFNNVIVTFNPDSHDGQAALNMCRQFSITDGKSKTIIYFKHFVDRNRKSESSDSDGSDSDESE